MSNIDNITPEQHSCFNEHVWKDDSCYFGKTTEGVLNQKRNTVLIPINESSMAKTVDEILKKIAGGNYD